jgi:hypothetical protein
MVRTVRRNFVARLRYIEKPFYVRPSRGGERLIFFLKPSAYRGTQD